jgi:tetratricopeptide (TPR) repeat protein
MSAPTPEEKTPPSDRRVLVGLLLRKRQRLVTSREALASPPVRRPAHVARMLALVHHLQSAIYRGLVPNRATVAKRLGLTRAWVMRLLDLLLLAPDRQDQVLHLEAVDGVEHLSERALRAVAHADTWAEQRTRWSGGQVQGLCRLSSNGTTLGDVRTLGWVDYTLMRAPVPPSTWSLTGAPALEELRAAYASGNLVVFAGAGISQVAGIPSWARVVELLADHPRLQQARERRQELLGLLQQRKLPEALALAEHVLGRSEMGPFVEKMLSDEHVDPPEVARAIAALAPRLRAVLTTNLDHLLERAFEGRWPALWQDLFNIVRRERIILKLHGTLLDRDSWIFTRQHYDRATWGDAHRREMLSHFFRAFPLLFVGYEFEDEDFDAVLSQVRALAGSNPPRNYALVPHGSLGQLRREHLERAGIHLLEYHNPDGKHEEARRLLQALAASTPVEGSGGSPSPPPESACPPVSPFPGLECFNEDRAAFFFGRETEANKALQSLGDTPLGQHVRWLQVEGASGTGKSSFARAGLVPRIRQGWVGDAPSAWRVAVLKPGRHPLLSLAQALHAALGPTSLSQDEFARSLHNSPSALPTLLRQYTPKGHGLLLVIDQFEEFFTLVDESNRIAFDEGLATALEDSGGPLYLVTTIRSDFVGRLSLMPRLERLQAREAARYRLEQMTPVGLRAAIQQPSKKVGLQWEPGLIERLLEDSSATEASLPLLAHVLSRLWEGCPERCFTYTAYERLGGLTGALTESANQLIGPPGSPGYARARDLLLALVTLQGGRPSRRSLTRAEALVMAGGDAEAEVVLNRLSGARGPTQRDDAPAPARLIVVNRSDGQDRVDLVHEALLMRWATFSDWLRSDEVRKALDRRDDLEAAARLWKATGETVQGLVSGEQLTYLRKAVPVTTQAREFLRQAEVYACRLKRVMLIGLAIVIACLVSMSSLAFDAFRRRGLTQEYLAKTERFVIEIDQTIKRRGFADVAAEVRRELLETIANQLETPLEGVPNTAEVLQCRMVAISQRGDWAMAYNSLELARQEYEAACAMAQRLDRANLNPLLTRPGFAVCLAQLGTVAQAQGRLDDARDSFQRAYELFKALSASNPSDVTLRLGLISSELSLADLARTAKDPQAFRAHLANAQKSLDELRQLPHVEGSKRYEALQGFVSLLKSP